MSNRKYRQIGRFRIHLDFLDLSNKSTLEIFRNIIVVEATAHFYDSSVHYLALCKDFEPIPEGGKVPEYLPIVKMWALERDGEKYLEPRLSHWEVQP